jgi:hypothetical protein
LKKIGSIYLKHTHPSLYPRAYKTGYPLLHSIDSNVSRKGKANAKKILHVHTYHTQFVFLTFWCFILFFILAHHLPLKILFCISFWQVSERKSVFSSHTLDIIPKCSFADKKCIKTSFAYWWWCAWMSCQNCLYFLIGFGKKISEWSWKMPRYYLRWRFFRLKGSGKYFDVECTSKTYVRFLSR